MRIMQIQNKDCIHDSCRICDKKYNILLHVESKNRVRTTNILIVMDKEIMNETQYTKFIIFIYIKWNNNFIYSDNNCKESIWKRKVLLSTSQSQSHFINRAMLKRLGFIRIRTHVVEIGDFAHRIEYSICIEIVSKYYNFRHTISYLILPKITGNVSKISFRLNQNLITSEKLTDSQIQWNRHDNWNRIILRYITYKWRTIS